MDDFLDRLVASVTSARSLEELTRPLLEMLQTISGLDSAYLTVIDLAKDEQRILFSHNTRTMNIPEGLAVPWGDTLCKRALDEGQQFTSNVLPAGATLKQQRRWALRPMSAPQCALGTNHFLERFAPRVPKANCPARRWSVY